MKGRAITYSDEELAWIEARKKMPRKALHSEFVDHFDRADVSQQNLTALCKRKGWMTGRTGHFEGGHDTWNKGLHYMPKGCEKTWFRKGERQGVAVKLYKPIGTERVSKNGYREMKVNDDLPLQGRWRAVHLINWEERNGPVPEGHCLKCLDGDRSNVDPENWKAIPRAMLPRLAGRHRRVAYDSAEPEIKPVLMAMAEIEHRARQAKKGRSK